MNSRKYVTMKDIADSLGLSVTSVSKALRNHPDISKSTRLKVLQAVEEQGYIRDAQASSLRQRRSNTIGIVASDASNPFFNEVLTGVEVATKERGFRLLLGNSEADEELESTLIQTMMEKRIDGLILTSVEVEKAQKKLQNIPNVVIMGCAMPEWNFTVVDTQERKGSYLSTTHLIEQGCKKIVMLANYIFYRTTEKVGVLSPRLEGYRDALQENGFPFQKDHLFVNRRYNRGNRLADGYTIMKEALEVHPDLDGVFCYNDLTAYGALKALKEMKIQVPHQIAIVGYDNLYMSEIVSPPLSSVQFEKFEMGYMAAQTLIESLHDPDRTPKYICLDTELCVRESSSRHTAKLSYL